MKHTKLSKREELLFELQGWMILSGEVLNPEFSNDATIQEIAMAIMVLSMRYEHRMVSQGILGPMDPRNQFSLN